MAQNSTLTSTKWKSISLSVVDVLCLSMTKSSLEVFLRYFSALFVERNSRKCDKLHRPPAELVLFFLVTQRFFLSFFAFLFLLVNRFFIGHRQMPKNFACERSFFFLLFVWVALRSQSDIFCVVSDTSDIVNVMSQKQKWSKAKDSGEREKKQLKFYFVRFMRVRTLKFGCQFFTKTAKGKRECTRSRKKMSWIRLFVASFNSIATLISARRPLAFRWTHRYFFGRSCASIRMLCAQSNESWRFLYICFASTFFRIL